MDRPKKTRPTPEVMLSAAYFAIYLVIGLSLLLKQPFGNPPDEYSRYLIPAYIAQHGSLPNGYDETIRIGGYGFSYAFQPILPYIIQGYVLRAAGLFADDPLFLLYAARSVNLVFGLFMAVVVRLLAQKWFADTGLRYLFCCLVMFLPQSIFLHTYVNTDSCCMFSTALILYGLTCCLEDDFSCRSCILLSAGIILCAMSYYNAYGYILSAMLLFTAYFLHIQKGKLHLNRKDFLRKGLLISALVLAGTGWWFVRNFRLYDGDLLGLRARDECALLYAALELKPGSRVTYESLGFSLPDMLFHSDFAVLSVNSFIASYGPMIITTALWIYRFYKLLFPACLLLCLIPVSEKLRAPSLFPVTSPLYAGRPSFCAFYHANMLFCILTPVLLSLVYSYRVDYQPQGRYLMPCLIPLAYYCVRGVEKGFCLLGLLPQWFQSVSKPAGSRVLSRLRAGFFVLILFLIVLSLFVTVYVYAFPWYG